MSTPTPTGIYPGRLDYENAPGNRPIRDGDTFYLELKGPRLQNVQHRYTIKGRLAEADAPRGSTPEGQAATAYAAGRIGDAEQSDRAYPLTIATHGPEKYGRELVSIIFSDGSSLAADMIAAGHAVPYED